MEEKWTYWFEELGKDAIWVAGKKCANLGEMARAGLPVPPGFAISIRAYERFVEETGAAQEIRDYFRDLGDGPKNILVYEKASREIREIVQSKAIPPDIQETVAQYYQALSERCGTSDLPVAVRSSGPVSMPGQFDTYLNVIGVEELNGKIVECWASTFTSQAIAFRAQKGMPIESSPIGVAIQRVVNAKSAGVGFTIHPTTGDWSKMVVEGLWGMGEAVVGGATTPDRFVIDKETSSVEKSVSAKPKQVVLKGKGTGIEDVPTEKQNVPCLEDGELQRLLELGKMLEKHYGGPQDLEWVVARDLPFPANVFLVQTRPVTTAKEKHTTTDTIIDLMLGNVFKR